jgi:two-component system, NarL family, response regulator NreC
MDKIRVLLVDDHAMLRAGLALLLKAQPDIAVTGEAATGLEAIEMARSLDPDVILMDITMPGMGGIEAATKIRERTPASRILFLTMHEDEAFLRETLGVGAAGFIPKKAADTDLLTAIRAVFRDEIYIHPSVTRSLIDNLFPEAKGTERPETELYESLSSREKEVLQLVAQGYTNKQIAEKLFLSVKTVETYKARLMEKLDFHSRAELVRFAFGKGLLAD